METDSKLLSALLLVITVNLDSLGVGISFGAKKIRVPLSSNLIIAFITSFGTLLTIMAGKWLSTFFSPRLGNYIGAMVIIIIGLWVLYEEFRRRNIGRAVSRKPETLANGANGAPTRKLTDLLTEPPLADKDYSGHIDTREAFVLGGVLTLNNFAGGFGAGFLGLNPVLTSCAVAFCSLALLFLGIKLGDKYISRWLGNYAGTTAGLLLIMLGTYEMFRMILWETGA
jgi:putative sporulation protein YtaF